MAKTPALARAKVLGPRVARIPLATGAAGDMAAGAAGDTAAVAVAVAVAAAVAVGGTAAVAVAVAVAVGATAVVAAAVRAGADVVVPTAAKASARMRVQNLALTSRVFGGIPIFGQSNFQCACGGWRDPPERCFISAWARCTESERIVLIPQRAKIWRTNCANRLRQACSERRGIPRSESLLRILTHFQQIRMFSFGSPLFGFLP